MKNLLLPVTLALLLMSCGQEAKTSAATPETPAKAAPEAKPQDTDTRKYIEVGAKRIAEVDLSGCSESHMTGRVTFIEENGKVSMKAKMSNVNQGMHGFHIHAVGDCSSADGKSAGGHWNPTGEDHGKWGVAPFHRGDIGNFEADKNGVGKISLSTDLWCVGCGDPMKDVVGKAIIVHAGEDDCVSQPSGAAGARIACGVIELN